MAKNGSSRKHGRSLDRPSNKMYVLQNRYSKNKAKNIERDAKLKARAKARKVRRELMTHLMLERQLVVASLRAGRQP